MNRCTCHTMPGPLPDYRCPVHGGMAVDGFEVSLDGTCGRAPESCSRVQCQIDRRCVWVTIGVPYDMRKNIPQ
jgi:hypothetical protein